MPSSPFTDPSRAMVDHTLGDEYVSFRQRFEECFADNLAGAAKDVLACAAGAGLLAGEGGDLLKLALAAEIAAGRSSLRCLASDRYSLLTGAFGTAEAKSRIFASPPPPQALCIADRALSVELGGNSVTLNGTIQAVPAALEAEWLYLVVFEENGRTCYLVPADREGVTIEKGSTTAAADVVLKQLSVTKGDRLAASQSELEYRLAIIGVLDGLEALAAAQRICDEGVAAAKRNPVGSATGFDDQDIQFRFAAVQARLMIASGYRTSIFRELASGAIDPFKGAVAKLWLSQCAEEATRASVETGLAMGGGNSEVGMAMLADARRGNLLRDVVAAQL